MWPLQAFLGLMIIGAAWVLIKEAIRSDSWKRDAIEATIAVGVFILISAWAG